jgi:hypothetical protein
MTSYHPEDVSQGYCGHCRWWTSDPQLGLLMIYDQHQLRCDREQCIGCRVDLPPRPWRLSGETT